MTLCVASFSFSSFQMLMSHLGLSVKHVSVKTLRTSSGRARLLTGGGDVVTLRCLANLSDSLDSLVVEFNLLEVGTDAARGDRLGDDAAAANLGPGEDDLGRSDLGALGLAEAVGNGLDLRAVDEEGNAEVVVAKGRVGGDVNVLLVAVVNELTAGEPGVALDLIDGGDDTGIVDDGLELRRMLATF